ncbi:MAG: thioredoxin [Candidatus Omnitrophota bacterium]
MSLIHLSEKNFQKEVIESKLPVLVDFWATWCGPCQKLSPIIEELAREYHGKIKIGELDVGQDSNIASKYTIMSVPTILFFKQGKIEEQVVGAVNKSQLEAKIKELIL